MNTELNTNCALTSDQITANVEKAAITKISRTPQTTFMLAVTAGVFIGLAFIFYVVVTAGATSLPYGLTKLIGGVCFSLGLILVVIIGGELFTSTVLSITARLSHRVSTKALLKNWGIVYLGNFVGALILVLLMICAKHYTSGHGLVGLGYLKTAQAKLNYDFFQAFSLGILCNILVCLAVWMTYAGRTVTDKILAIIFPIAMFVASGFEHCIANMFLIPMAIITKGVASIEFWANAGVSPADFAELTWSQFVFHNLVPVTVGNIVGGAIFVGLTYWCIYRRHSIKKA